MTLQREGLGTGQYVPPSGGPSNDTFGQATPSFDYTRRQLPGVRFETFRTGKAKEIGWRFTVFDFRGGLNFVKGDLEAGHNRMKSSSLDTSFEEYGQAHLPLLTTSQATPDPLTSGRARIYGVNVLGGLVMATEAALTGGGTVPQSVFKETSDTDPTVTALTVSSLSAVGLVTSLNAISFAGSEPLLVVGSVSSAGQRVYDSLAATPNVAGTMHTDLQSLFGAIQVSLPDRPTLLYGLIGGVQGIGYLAGGAAISAQPSPAQTGVLGGGWAIGEQSLGGAPLRPYWVFPQVPAFGATGGTDSTYTLEAWKRGRARVESTNPRGTDRDALRFPLPWLAGADKLRDGIMAYDDGRVYFHNNRGYRYRNLGIFRDVSPNSDRQYVIQGHWIKDDELYMEVNVIASPSGAGNTTRHIRKYSFPYDTWHQVSADEILTDTGRQSMGGGRSLPVSDQTGYLHAYSNGAWKRMYAPPPGVNPYSLRQTAGAGSSTGVQFESTGELQMGELIFPGWLATMQKSVRRMGYLGDLDTGGAGSKVRLDAGGVFHEFKYGYRASQQVKDFDDNDYRFSFLAPKLTVTRGSNSRMTPQPLPFFIEGVCYDDRKAIKVISYT